MDNIIDFLGIPREVGAYRALPVLAVGSDSGNDIKYEAYTNNSLTNEEVLQLMLDDYAPPCDGNKVTNRLIVKPSLVC